MFNLLLSPTGSRPRFFQRRTHEASTFPLSPLTQKRGAQKFHLAILRIEVTRVSRGLSVLAELLVVIMNANRINVYQI